RRHTQTPPPAHYGLAGGKKVCGSLEGPRPPVGTSAACWCERRFRHVPFQGRSRIDYIICSRVRKENRPRALSRTVSEGRLGRLPVPACQDLVSVAVHVRFTPQSGHRSARRECPVSAKSVLTRCSKKDRYSIPLGGARK